LTTTYATVLNGEENMLSRYQERIYLCHHKYWQHIPFLVSTVILGQSHSILAQEELVMQSEAYLISGQNSIVFVSTSQRGDVSTMKNNILPVGSNIQVTSNSHFRGLIGTILMVDNIAADLEEPVTMK
jgi:hypothetical protein